MKIVIGSTSAPKVSAVKEVFTNFFNEDSVEIISIEVDSGVSPTPFSVDECILGGRNRIKKCLQQIPDADFYVGIESGIIQTAGLTFLAPWAVVFKRATDRESVGSGALVPLRAEFFSKIDPDIEISKTVRYEMFSDALIQEKNTLGVGGLVTQGAIKRHDQVCLALKVALATM